MPSPRYHVALDDTELAQGFEAIRAEMQIPASHSPEALAEADAVVARGPQLPPGVPHADPDDRRDLELVAIDPPGARDLDQAYAAEARSSGGYRVFYAIADLGSHITPGGAIDVEAIQRGVTYYSPDLRTSLHPDVLNEDFISLLPGQDRPSLLWTIDLDDSGQIVAANLARTLVQIRQSMTYRDAQNEIDGGSPRESLRLLKVIGQLRQEQERQRGAVSLSLPGQEIKRDEHGHRMLEYDESLPVENWNAQISLLTGIAAADIMLEHGQGILRTLPKPRTETIEAIRRTAAALDVEWPESMSYPDRVRTLDPAKANELALTVASARGLRGAGYLSFTSTDELPSEHTHSAIASTYAHVTAPLRRVVDRFANEVLLAACHNYPTPEWVLAALDELPKAMGRSGQRANALERAMVDYMEAVTLESSIGRIFKAMVVNTSRDGVQVQLRDPAVIANLSDKRPELGSWVRVKLTAADSVARKVTFKLVED